MKIAKRLSWHAAAIAAAALVVSGAASAGDRDGGHRRHDGYSHRGDHRNDHRRVWRDHGRNHYRYHDRGYRYDRYPRARHYHYNPRGYYGYSNNYYYAPWPDYGLGVTLRIPL